MAGLRCFPIEYSKGNYPANPPASFKRPEVPGALQPCQTAFQFRAVPERSFWAGGFATGRELFFALKKMQGVSIIGMTSEVNLANRGDSVGSWSRSYRFPQMCCICLGEADTTFRITEYHPGEVDKKHGTLGPSWTTRVNIPMCTRCVLRLRMLYALPIAVFLICLALVFLADETFNLGGRTVGPKDVTFFIVAIYLVIAALPAGALWAYLEKRHGAARIGRNGEIRFRNQQYDDLFRSVNPDLESGQRPIGR